MLEIGQWRHVFKLDPDKEISDEAIHALCNSGTDAILVGGTTNITYEKTRSLLERLRPYSLPMVLEVSSLEAIVGGFHGYFLPLVLNAGTEEWVFSPYIQGLKEYGSLMEWEEVYTEGYVVCNPDCDVARLTKSRIPQSSEDMVAYGRLADRVLKLPILYIEYSGVYGNPEWVRSVYHGMKDTLLFYGGGIRSEEEAREMSDWADCIVVGNIIYEDLQIALKTVKGAKEIEL